FQWASAGYGDGAHMLSVAFIDRAGNIGTVQNQVVVDNTAPSVSITSPANGAAIATSLNSVTATILESNGVIEKKVSIDGVAVAASEQNGIFTLTTPVTAKGQHTVAVTAKDTIGNVGQATSNIVITGNGGPGGSLGISLVGISNGSVLTGNDVTSLTSVVSGGTG